jgi:hypothetical protein
MCEGDLVCGAARGLINVTEDVDDEGIVMTYLVCFKWTFIKFCINRNRSHNHYI